MTTAKEVTFVNTGTTLTATEVQGALGQVMYRLNYDRDRIEVLEAISATKPDIQDLNQKVAIANSNLNRTEVELNQKTDELDSQINFNSDQINRLWLNINELNNRIYALESKAV